MQRDPTADHIYRIDFDLIIIGGKMAEWGSKFQYF
jgi:hypothetical protein